MTEEQAEQKQQKEEALVVENEEEKDTCLFKTHNKKTYCKGINIL